MALPVGWLIVSMVHTFLLARRIAALRALKRRATPIEFDGDLPRGARTLVSEASVPSAVGFLHPAILLPSGTIGTLDPKDARQIVLHEAAHLRRRDDLTGLVFLLCAALFWFNPFVHYIGKKLSLECEIACDEIVVGQSGDATRYATLLFEMAQSIAGGDPQLAWSRFVHQSGLVVRIQNVLLYRDTCHRALPRHALVALMAVLLSSVGVAAFNAPALGRAENDASVRVRPMSSDSAAHGHEVMDVRECVRAFPVCKLYSHPGHPSRPGARSDARMQNVPKFCDDPAMQFPPFTTRIKKGTETP